MTWTPAPLVSVVAVTAPAPLVLEDVVTSPAAMSRPEHVVTLTWAVPLDERPIVPDAPAVVLPVLAESRLSEFWAGAQSGRDAWSAVVRLEAAVMAAAGSTDVTRRRRVIAAARGVAA